MKESKSKPAITDDTALKESMVVPLTTSTPVKSSKESAKDCLGKESKSSKSISSKLKVPKHQAFANMSFEDEASPSTSGGAGGTVLSGTVGLAAAHPHPNLHHVTTNTSSGSNAVTITRC